MSVLNKPETYHGPAELERAFAYFHDAPTVGLVVVRNLLTPAQVQHIEGMAREYTIPTADGSQPDGARVRDDLREALSDNGIDLDTLHALNSAYWDADDTGSMEKLMKIQFTEFGISLPRHCDFLRSDLRPVGVAASISFGEGTFEASLPPSKFRQLNPEAVSESYIEWRDGTCLGQTYWRETVSYGDAAVWLQPGCHTAIAVSPDRFAAILVSPAKLPTPQLT